MNTHPESSGRAQRLSGWHQISLVGMGLLWGIGLAHGNDEFSNATRLSGSLPISESKKNSSATAEVGEPDHDFDSITEHSLWFKWTAPSDMVIEVNTFGSTPLVPTPGLQFDTVLAVYTGTSVGALDKIIGNDDTFDPSTSNTKQSRVRFSALSGVTYRIAVDGYSGEVGEVDLNLLASPTPRPANDHIADAVPISGALPWDNFSAPDTNVAATIEADEPQHYSEDAFSASVWYTWVASADGSAAALTNGSDFDTVLAVYRENASGDLVPVASNDDNDQGAQSTVEFFANINETYYFAVDGFGNSEGDVHFNLKLGLGSPPNDNLSTAVFVGDSNTVNTNGPTGGATIEIAEASGDPTNFHHHEGIETSSSVWFSWQAPADVSSSIEINTFGSNFDTVLAVYTGTNYTNLAKIVSNDDAGAITSRVRFIPVPLEIYRIAIDGKEGAQGAALLNILPGPARPANDDFDNAIALVNDFAFGNNLGATVETSEPIHVAGLANNSSVWFTWTAGAGSRFRARTFGSDYDTTVAIYSGTAIDELVQLGSNDNAGGITSQALFDATEGETYYIAVSGKNLAEGNIQLTVDTVGAYAEWLTLYPSLVDDDSLHSADRDGDGYPNLIEMLCGLNPTVNSRPEVGDDPNAPSAPVYQFIPPNTYKLSFTIDPNFIGVPRNGGDPVTFGGELLGIGITPTSLVAPTSTGINAYEITTTVSPDAMTYLRVLVVDPNSGPN